MSYQDQQLLATETFLNSPFHVENEAAYQRWRIEKLSGYPVSLSQLTVAVHNPLCLMADELHQIKLSLQKTNMVIYAMQCGNPASKDIPRKLGLQMGLRHLDKNECADDDGFTSLQVQEQGLHQLYIPYSNRAISWHTDGYYNPLTKQIFSLILHCVRAAESGGENQLMDPEICYLLLRDQNPGYIQALMQPDCMTIPRNVLNGKLVRPDRSGPVFSITGQGRLHMRYTARSKNVIWKDAPLVLEARNALTAILNSESDYLFTGRLLPGQGLVCNNVLHTRTAFTDNEAQPRLLYRGRYFDKIAL